MYLIAVMVSDEQYPTTDGNLNVQTGKIKLVERKPNKFFN